MTVYTKKVVDVHITPMDLRSIADIAEHKWEKIMAGESAVFFTIYGNDAEVRLIFDQEGMRRKQG